MAIPVFEDWESASLLCGMIDDAFKRTPHRVRIIFIDDGSFTPPDDLAKIEPSAVSEIDILHLQRNIGHQRAIAVALAWIEQNASADAVIVMDGDGEDLPEDIPALLDRAAETRLNSVVFAERGKRMDGLVFRALYLCYRTAHRLLTGRGIRFGNFSVIPFRFLRRMTTMPELWGHYAAAVLNARIPYSMVRVNRGHRLRGATKMSLEALILHGLAAVAVYQAVSVRVLIGSAALAGFFTLLAAVTAALHIQGWTAIAGICLVLTCIIAFNAILYVFTSLSFRHMMGVLPARDYVYFVDRCARMYPVEKRQATSAV
jgi:polyisoprenyl-phosphate glycosyltransferase